MRMDLRSYERQTADLAGRVASASTKAEAAELERSAALNTAEAARENTNVLSRGSEALRGELVQSRLAAEERGAECQTLRTANTALVAQLNGERRRYLQLEQVISDLRAHDAHLRYQREQDASRWVGALRLLSRCIFPPILPFLTPAP